MFFDACRHLRCPQIYFAWLEISVFPRTVTQLMEMGFERAQVERCLQVPVPVCCPHWSSGAMDRVLGMLFSAHHWLAEFVLSVNAWKAEALKSVPAWYKTSFWIAVPLVSLSIELGFTSFGI